MQPTSSPTMKTPTRAPSKSPTRRPSRAPSKAPTRSPTHRVARALPQVDEQQHGTGMHTQSGLAGPGVMLAAGFGFMLLLVGVAWAYRKRSARVAGDHAAAVRPAT